MRTYNPQSNPLPLGRSDNVKNLFKQPGWMDFLEVIQSRAKLLEVEALNAQAESHQFEKFEGKSLSSMKAAQKYRMALEVIKEVESEPKTYTIVESIR